MLRRALRLKTAAVPLLAAGLLVGHVQLASAAGPTTTFQIVRGGVNRDVTIGVSSARDGSFLTIGWRQVTSTNTDIWVTKSNYAGTPQWERTYGQSGIEVGYDVIQTRDGGFAFVAERGSSADLLAGVLVYKINSNGAPVWNRLYVCPEIQGDFGGASIVELPTGDLVIAGRWPQSSSQQRMLLARLSAEGAPIWASRYNDQRHPAALSGITEVKFVNAEPPTIVAAGYTGAFASPRQVLVARFNALTGAPIQARVYTSTTISAYANGLTTLEGGAVAFTARVISTPNDSLFISTDAALAPTLGRRFGRFLIADRSLHRVATATPVAGFALAGTFPFGSTFGNTFGFHRLSTDGSILFSSGFGGTASDLCLGMTPTSDGGYVLVGSTESFAATIRDSYIIKTDAQGRSGCNVAITSDLTSPFEPISETILLGVGSVESRVVETIISDAPTATTLLCRRCPADFDQNGTVDFFDYLDYIIAFDDDQPAADLNGDGVIDFFDYLDFVEFFTRGC